MEEDLVAPSNEYMTIAAPQDFLQMHRLIESRSTDAESARLRQITCCEMNDQSLADLVLIIQREEEEVKTISAAIARQVFQHSDHSCGVLTELNQEDNSLLCIN